MNRAPQSRFSACVALAASTALVLLPTPVAAQPTRQTPTWLTCPNELALDIRPSPDRDPARIRQIAPSAGAATSAEIFSHARYADVAYTLYAAFDAGLDPWTAFSSPTLTLQSLIYGTPGPNTERASRRGRTRTLYGFIADEPASGRRYIVFRGTMEPAEWARNIQAVQRPYPSGAPARTATAHVHAGFLEIFDSLEVQTRTQATPFAAALPALIAGRDTVFVGHSLGSALTTLAGVEAGRRAPEMRPRIRVVTLASPRVGDAGFALLAGTLGRIDRVCNLVDVVTAVPPSTPQASYVHVGTPFRVSSFDWPALANDLQDPGQQILCWHNQINYTLMLNPAQSARPPAECLR